MKIIADALAAQMFDEDDEEGPGLAVDREHFPLLRDRAALAAVGDGMLSALSSNRFSGQVGGRAPPVSDPPRFVMSQVFKPFFCK